MAEIILITIVGIVFFVLGFVFRIIVEMTPDDWKENKNNSNNTFNEICEYTIYAKHPNKGDLGELLHEPTYHCTFEDLGKDWLNNIHSKPIKVTITAKNGREACMKIVNKLPVLYSGMGKLKICEERYALFAVYVKGKFLNYYWLFD